MVKWWSRILIPSKATGNVGQVFQDFVRASWSDFECQQALVWNMSPSPNTNSLIHEGCASESFCCSEVTNLKILLKPRGF